MRRKHINSYDLIVNILKIRGDKGVKQEDFVKIIDEIRKVHCETNAFKNYKFEIGSFAGNPSILKIIGIGDKREYFIKDDENSKLIFDNYKEDTNLFLIINDYYINKSKSRTPKSPKIIDPNLGTKAEDILSNAFTKKI